VTLTLSEEPGFHAFFSPSCVVATPGSTLTVVLRNSGTQRHNLSIASRHIDKDVPVGKTARVKVRMPASEPLLFECKYHVTGGMKGAFIPEG
jgi:plastocyanin